MNILILGEVGLDESSKLSFQFFTSVFSYRSVIFESQLAAITPKEHTTKVLKANEKINFDEDFDAVLINFKTSAAPGAYKTADKFKKKGVKVILAGQHTSALPKEAETHADSIILGVAEKIWPKVVEDLEKGKLKPKYDSTKIKDFPLLPSTADLMIDSDFKIVAPIEATRGCPEKCAFCQYSNAPDGSTFYTRPIEDVIKEIKSLPQKILYFKDLSLTIKPSYTKELFKNMKGLKKKFLCHGNINVLARDEELVRLSHEAGCIEWIIGFESFSQNTLNNIQKSSNKVKDYQKAVEMMHKYKISVNGTFVFGFDEDTPDVFKATAENIYNLGLDSAIFAVLTPYPGTPLFNKLKKEGRILTYDWFEYNRKNIVFQPKNMTIEELENGYKQLTKQFNSAPRVTYRILRSLRRGFYPAFFTFGSNIGSYMASINRSKA